MRLRIPRRLIAPLIACGIAGAAAVAGGACVVTPAPPPSLRTGSYVLTSPGTGIPPGTIVDEAGRRLRVIADTLRFVVEDETYEEHAMVAITPPGGTEAPPAPFVVSRRAYSISSPRNFVLPSTLLGTLSGEVLSATVIQLAMPDHTVWRYDYR